MTTTPSSELDPVTPEGAPAGTAGTAGAAEAQAPAVPRTTVPVPTPLPPGAREVPRRPGAVKPAEVYAVLGALAGGVGLTVLLFQYLLPFNGALGFVVVSWFSFLGLYGLLIALEEDGPAVRDRIASAIVHSLAALVLLALVFTVGFTAFRGWHAPLWHANFFTKDLSDADSLTPLSVGGVAHGAVGTLEQISIALVLTVPLGVATAVFLNEVPGAFARFVRTITEAMTALPSVLAGLFAFTIFVPMLGWGHSGFAAGCALSVMMLPIIIRASDVVLRLVPASLKEASYALGAGRLKTALTVVLPTARSGLMTAVILGTARGIGETSPVLLTAGYTKNFNWDPFHGPQVSLPLVVFNLVRLPAKVQIERGFGAAVVLLLLVVSLFAVARIIGGRPAGTLTAGQQRRRAAASGRLAARYLSMGGVAASVVPDRKERGVPRRLPALLRRATGAAALLTALSLMFLWTAAPRAMASSYVPISGAGSTWSSNAMDAWTTNVKQLGMRVDYSPTGSSDGRAQFRSGAQDFAVSEIPYGVTDQGVTEPDPPRKHAYMPIVAGGTSFMYNLRINGRKVTTLRLSGDTIAGIFTGAITQWSDPAIAHDNPSLVLPARKIVVVVRSDGSGTTAQLSTWLSKRHQTQWDAYCGRAGRKTPCGVTSFYPIDPKNPFNAQSGSLGVSGFVAQDANEGSITYVEYSYARNSGYPVAKMLNAAGYFVEPTAPAVAVALTKATINADLTQNLEGVYDNADPRTYPLSSYSYMILPTKLEYGFTLDKGHTLGDFAYYFLCKGQKLAPDLGYSPLPRNLVEAGFAQIAQVPGVVKQNPDLSTCDNPTFSKDGSNLLATTAPYPPACDKQGGPTQCSTGTGGAAGPGGGSGGTGSSSSTSGQGAVGVPLGGNSASAAADPGLVGGGGTGSGSGSGSDGGATVNADPVAIGATASSTLQHVLMALAAVLFASVVVVPPVIARQMQRRRMPR